MENFNTPSYLSNALANATKQSSGKGNIWFMVIVIICILILFGLVIWALFKPTLNKTIPSNSTNLTNPTFDSITINKDAIFLGNVTMGASTSTLGFKAASNLTVNYDSIFNGLLNASSLDVSGTTNLGALNASSLDVSGTTNLENLNISGTTSFTTLDLTTLNVSGTTNLNNLNISGTTSFGDIGDLNVLRLGVTGASTFYGNSVVGGTLGVTGASTFYGNSDIKGNSIIKGNLGVSGASTFYDNINIKGNLGLTGSSIFYGDTIIAGNFGVTGAATFYKGINSLVDGNNLTTTDFYNLTDPINSKGRILGTSSNLFLQGAKKYDGSVYISKYAGVDGSIASFDTTTGAYGGRTTIYGPLQLKYGDEGPEVYKFDVPTGPGELNNNLRLVSNETTYIMNAKPDGNQVHFMNGSSDPKLLIGNTGLYAGMTGARVYDDTFYPPPTIGSDPTFNTVTIDGTGMIGGALTVSGTGSFSLDGGAIGDFSGYFKGGLAFGIPSIPNKTYFRYSPTTNTINYTPNAVGWPTGTPAGNFAGIDGTDNSRISGGDLWSCPVSGLWNVSAYMISSDNVTSKIGISSTDIPQVFPDGVTVTDAGFNYLAVNTLVYIKINQLVSIGANSGTVGTFYVDDGVSAIGSFMQFDLITAFT